MTPTEHKEMKELIQNYLENSTTKTDAKFELIVYKLDKVIEQTTRTNGRVSKLEDITLTHPMTCPQITKIRELEDTQLTHKAIKTWVVTSILVTSGIFTILLGLFKLFFEK
jgi:hypothetical protein